MDLKAIMDMVMQQGVWCALFVYLFYTTQKTAREREDKLTILLSEQGKQIKNIANTLDSINTRVDKIEDKIDV